jgi:hypothetical protein
MGSAPRVDREWTLDVSFGVAQMRCRYSRQGKVIESYTVQLEIWHDDDWRPVVRFDNAHGFCHCDTIHPDGSQDRSPVHRGDAGGNFTWAIHELRSNWDRHRDRFLAEVKP